MTDPTDGRGALAALLEDRGELDRRRLPRRAGPSRPSSRSCPSSGSRRGHSRMTRPSIPREILRVGQPHVHDREAARLEMLGERRATLPPGPHASPSSHQRVEGDEAQPERAGLRQGGARRCRPRRARAWPHRSAACAARCRARASIAGSMSTPMTRWPGRDSGTASRPRADAELEHRSARPVRQRYVQVDIARVVGKIEVVEAGERRGGRLGCGRSCHALSLGPHRTAPALALDGERADRLERQPGLRPSLSSRHGRRAARPRRCPCRRARPRPTIWRTRAGPRASACRRARACRCRVRGPDR